MDDEILAEPKLSIRPWLSAQALEDSARRILRIFGPFVINEEKNQQEGNLSTEQLIWGLHMDTQAEQVRLPQDTVAKI